MRGNETLIEMFAHNYCIEVMYNKILDAIAEAQDITERQGTK
jgi:hypothetical protein